MTTLAANIRESQESNPGTVIGILSLLTALLLIFAFGLPIFVNHSYTYEYQDSSGYGISTDVHP